MRSREAVHVLILNQPISEFDFATSTSLDQKWISGGFYKNYKFILRKPKTYFFSDSPPPTPTLWLHLLRSISINDL